MSKGELIFANEPSQSAYDAIVVGAGPNGLAAAITLAQAQKSVLLVEGRETIGGGTRTAELTLPGFKHDVCSAIHAMGVVSPFFLSLPLAEHGLVWDFPEVAAAHPLDGGRAAVFHRSLDTTCEQLGQDGAAYRRLIGPLVANAEQLLPQILAPPGLPKHPFKLLSFGMKAMRSAAGLAQSRFREDLAPAGFAGMAAHAILPLEQRFTAAIGLVLALTVHLGGWPVARGGSQQIADAMARYLRSLGGEIAVNRRVASVSELPTAKAILLDVAPMHLSQIAADELPASFRSKLDRYRHGPGVFKVDWALSGPVPWQAPGCRAAGTVHVGGTIEEVCAAERAAARGEHADRPFVLVAQQSLCDATRAPEGQHTLWGYCHVPSGSTIDMTEKIEAQIERFAPGFRDLILARHVLNTDGFAARNPNYIGGDIAGGSLDLAQMFTRPTMRRVPYSTPNERIFICSASSPPGAGVHGMCGLHAARAALRGVLR